ncbi:piggyBac transposable element-derived protein 4-like isoform X1 [Ceratina calcarata]|uniref:PiggyBac transposable element-derived protein 4-like isoform X1 n=2 Tax=Ceratina calcarata TaxID=156304 RepID=A0AAJ7W8M9_9HYME|nr:piggyBac transposable element-derived protein 4-like isoform X1 [Ceratina calcarata]
MDDAGLVRIIDELCITEEHGDSDEDEQLFAPSRRCDRRIYSDSESSEKESQDEDNKSDSDESLTNFREVNVENDIQYNPRPLFLEMTGPKHMPPNISKPIEYFNLFFTLQFLDMLRIETNRYAQQFFENAGAANTSTTLTWKKTTIKELRAFIAVLLEMGITRRPTIFSYWSQNHRYIPWFGQMFSRNRFQLLCKFFHTVDNSTLPARDNSEYDSTAKFEPVVAHANRKFKFHYSPHQHLSVDESLVRTKSRSALTQYLPNKKHHKWGIKFWMLADGISHYCLLFFCYRGAKDQRDKREIKEKGLAQVVIDNLLSMSNYFIKGYHITVDNFFTSIALARSLFEKNTFLSGTIRSNRKHIPSQLKSKLEVGEYKYQRNREILLLAYREKKSQKKNVLLLSTHGTAANKTIVIRRRNQEREVQKPALIHDYNKYMGGIDVSDMMIYSYLDERRTVKYWKKVVFSIFARMVLNAYILYQHNREGKLMTRLEFITSIIQSISTEWMAEKNMNPESSLGHTSRDSTVPGIRKLPGRREKVCVVCSRVDGGPVRRLRTICNNCNKGLHGICISKHQC